MKLYRFACLTAALLLVAGCNIQFASPAFPKDTASGDSVSGDTGVDAPEPDFVGPDVVEIDLKGKVCVDLEGLCISDMDDFEVNPFGCPWGYESVEVGGCGEDERCCIVSPQCSGEGELFDVQDEGIGCCPWLGSRDVCHVVGADGCDCPGEKYVCTDCGDGECSAWENPCSCPEDCPFEMNECEELGGECAPGCPPGHPFLDFAGCPDDAVCCAIEGECLEEGQQGKDQPGTPPCCEGLEPLEVTVWLSSPEGNSCEIDEGSFVCSHCGDGACEDWESWCTCLVDCKQEDNLCLLEGHTCKGFCPEGWHPNGLPGCAPGKKCCEESDVECLGEGEGLDDISAQEIECCEGLTPIENGWMEDDGGCEYGPGFFCSDCGNQECDPWENECSCPQDCGMMPPEWCEPWGTDASSACPDTSMFCVAPAFSCDTPGVYGDCMEIGWTCPEIFSPVCTCKGNEYDNECEAHQAEEQVAWHGPCQGSDGEVCVGLGETSGTNPGINVKCCGDLDELEVMEPTGDGCMTSPGFVCGKCGDELCGPGENECNCPMDCMMFGEPGG